MKKKNKIVVSGGNGRFATVLKNTINSKNYCFPRKSQMNILNLSSLEKYLKLKKPKYFMHAAALSRPMNIHDKEISQRQTIEQLNDRIDYAKELLEKMQ